MSVLTPLQQPTRTLDLRRRSSRLLHVMAFRPKGHGSFETFLLELASRSHHEGYKTRFVFDGQPVEWFADELAPFADWCIVPHPFSTAGLRKVCSEVKSFRPHLTTTTFLSLLGWQPLWLSLRTPLMGWDHTSADVPERRGMKRLLAKARGRLFSRRYRRIISVSEFNRRRNVDRNFIDPRVNVVVENGVRIPNSRSAHRESDDRRYLMYVGQIEHVKGVGTLLKAFLQFAALHQHDDLELWLAGAGSALEELQQFVAKSPFGERIRFLGYRNDVPDLLAGSVAQVVPSEWPEAFGLVVAEGMLAGTPLIVSDAGAIPDLVGPTAEVFQRGNVASLLAAIRRMTSPEYPRSEMIEAARSRALSRFTLSRMVERYLEVIGDCL